MNKKKLKNIMKTPWTKSKVIALIIVITLVIVAIQFGIVTYKHYSMNRLIETQQVEQQDAREQYQKKQAAIQKRQDHLKNKMNDYIKAQQGQIGISYYELKTQEGFDLNGDVQFLAGNMVSVPLSLMVAGKVDHHEMSWKKPITINGQQTSQNLDSYMRAMIEHDDSEARLQLIQAVGGTEALLRYMKANDKETDVVDATGNLTMSPKTMVHYLLTLEENKDNRDSYTRIQAYMAKNKGKVGMLYTDKTAGEVEQVYTKSMDDNTHAAGIVDGKNPFIIAIFTKGQPNANECIETLVNMAKEN